MMNATNAPPSNLFPQSRWKPQTPSLRNSRSSSFHGNCCVFIIPSSSTSRSINVKRPKLRALVRAAAGGDGGGGGKYRRVPMDTKGAYQLIDEESGQKVIVWGGTEDDDDDDTTIPSKDVLSWTPSHQTASASVSAADRKRNSNEGTKSVSAVSSSASPTTHARGLGGRSFDRLKTQRVRRVLSRKTSTIEREEVNEYDDKLVLKNNAPRKISNNDSYSGLEYTSRKAEKVHALRLQDSVSQVSRSEAFREDTKQKTWRRKDMGHSDGATVEHAEQLQQDPAKARNYENKLAGIDSSVPKKSDAYLSKWGDGESTSTHNFRTEGSLMRLHKSSTDTGFFSRKSFRDLGCSDYMIESLRAQGFLRPSHIQGMAFSPVLEGKSCIVSDQSGSGKTLAYLVPVIQRLRQEELQGVSKSSSQSPRVVVLVPTAELASQVLSNCRSISKSGVPFRSMVATGGFRQKTQLESLQQDLDVLIATPGRFLFLIKEGFLQLKNIRCVVLDEVDILVRDEDFEVALQIFINSSPVTTQYLFVTATLPTEAYNKLVEVFPDCEVIMGPSMHRTSIGLEEVLVDCSGDYESERNPETAFLNKKSALLRLVEGSSVSKTIVFCNKIETCRKVENILTRYDRKGVHMRVLSFHAALTQQSRLANMSEFLSSHSEKDALFLICTDRASRGIDFAGVDHVILFDFPRDPSEYVRRVGRTARGAGGKGTAFVFVVGKQVSLARRIMERNQKGQPLHDVPCMY